MNIQRGWLALLEEQIATAQERGELAKDVDPSKLAFQLYAPLELANFLATLYRDPVFVDHGRSAVHSTLARTKVSAG